MARRDELGIVMPNYMLLSYAPEADETETAERWAELPLWLELTESLREAGLLVAHAPQHPAASATTVRVRDGEPELTDGPFAVTTEILRTQAARFPRAVRRRVVACRAWTSNGSQASP